MYTLPHSQAFPPSSFCCVQKQRGGRLGRFYHVNDISVYLGIYREREGYPIEKTSLMPYLVVSTPSS